MIEKHPKVYIGIVTYNSKKDIASCLSAVKQQDYKHITIVIFDNNSSDKTIVWVHHHYSTIHLILSDINIGFGKAHNKIIEACHLQSEDYYMPLNPDVVLDPFYVSNLVHALRKHHAQWGVGKLYLSKEKKLLYSVGHALRRDGFAFNIGHDCADARGYSMEREIFGAPAAASIISAHMIQKVSDNEGLFDSSFFMYYEDVELDWRARRMGLICWFTPNAIAVHRGAKLSQSLELESILNRYLSVVKNAFLSDLLFYNIPIIFFHCLTRILLTPTDGILLAYRFVRLFPVFLKKRTNALVSQKEIHKWFSWSAKQRTNQSTTYLCRAKTFFYRRMLRK